MPLLDHFHPPVSERRSWEGFHGLWAAALVEKLNRGVLPAVQVFSTSTGASLAGAIELVSPGNKDRPEARRAFAAKCVSYLTRGIGLIVVDIVTNRLANLHNEVISLLGHGAPFLLAPSATTYAVAYRPSRQPDQDQIELWPTLLALGKPLPVLPLALRNAGVVPVDLDETYGEARETKPPGRLILKSGDSTHKRKRRKYITCGSFKWARVESNY